jgi:hypothetical protein
MGRPRDGKPMRRIACSITEESYIRLETVAGGDRGSVAQVIRPAVEEYLALYDDPKQSQLPLRRGTPR